MKIGKFLRHRGVDTVLQSAIPDLVLIQVLEDRLMWVDTLKSKNPYTIRGENEDKDFDVFIIDDADTYKWFTDKGYSAGKIVFYVHGTYSQWIGMQQHLNKILPRAHFMITDYSRGDSFKTWYKGKVLSELVIPIHLPDVMYPPLPTTKNGRISIIGSRLLKTCGIYDGPASGKILEAMFDRFGDLIDVLGWNDLEDDREQPYARIPAKNCKGYMDMTKAGEYSVSVHPSFVPTMGFVLLETIASGCASLCTPKVDFGADQPAFTSKDPEDFIRRCDTLLSLSEESLLEVSNFSVEVLKKQFPFSHYQEKVNEWMEAVYRA